MNFAEKNEESLDALVFALSERGKTTILIGIYDADTTRDQAIAHINRQLKSQHKLTLDLFGNKISSLLAYFRENLPPPKEKTLPIVHVIRLDPLLFTTRSHKVVSSDLVAQINMEREMLFHETQALVVIWLSRDGYNRLRMDAPDFMDWVAASFVFEKADSETVGQTLSFTLPRETTEDRSKAALLELSTKADKLQQRTVKFEQRAKLSTKDAKEYFNLLLALITVLQELHDLPAVQTTIEKAYALAKAHQLDYEFEMGKLLIEGGDAATALGQMHKARDIFEEALRHFTQWSDQPNRAVAHERLGETHIALGDLPRALEYFEEYNQLVKELYETFPNHVGYKNGLAISYEKLGVTHSALGDLSRALEYFEEYNRLEKELHEAFPQLVGFKSNLAISYSKLGDTHSDLGDLLLALEYFEEYNQLVNELYETFPNHVGYKNGLAISYEKLGVTHSSLGDPSRALEYFEEYNRLEKELHEAFPQNVEFKHNLAVSYSKLGDTHRAQGDLPRALEYFEERNRLAKELHESFPQHVVFKNGLAISYSKLGETYSERGELSQALEYFEKTNQLINELHESFPLHVEYKNNLAVSSAKLGAIHTSLGDFEQALRYFEEFNRLGKYLYDHFPQNVNFKSNFAESLALLYAVNKLISDSFEVAQIDRAIQLFEELYERSQRAYDQKKSDICVQMKSANGEELKHLILKMNTF